MSKTVEMIQEAKGIKRQMIALARTDPKVQEYLRLQVKREKLHAKLKKHIQHYNVQVAKYKQYGLVASNRSSVNVKKCHDLAEWVGGDVGKRIFKLIEKKFVVYTR